MAREADDVVVTIKNWDRYNPRSDVKRPSWFRLEHDLLSDPDFYGFSHEEFHAWIYILAQASRKSSAQIHVNYGHAKATAKLNLKAIRSAIEKLSRLGMVTADVTSTSRERTQTGTTNERTNERDETNERTPDFDFDALYKKYPRKVAKTEALARLERLIGSQEDYDACAKAIGLFTDYHRGKGTEEKYIPHMASFLGVEGKECWRDWLDPETGTSAIDGAGKIDIGQMLRGSA